VRLKPAEMVAITWSGAGYRCCRLALCFYVGPSHNIDVLGSVGERLLIRLADHDDIVMLVFVQFIDELKCVRKYAAIDDDGRRRMCFKHR